MLNPDLLWNDTTQRFAKQSKCRSRQVGAILVDRFGHQFGQGWNGAPKGSDCSDCTRCNAGNVVSGAKLEDAVCNHAEANLIGHAAKAGRSTDQATLYCTTFPCLTCANLIVEAGIVEVVYDQPYNSPRSARVFELAGVRVRTFQT